MVVWMVVFEREAEAGCDAHGWSIIMELPYQRLLSFFFVCWTSLLNYDHHERRAHAS
jgi:hypothetical protein